MKVKAIITLTVNGKDHLPGAVVDIAEDEAKRLIERGFASAQGQEKAAAATNPPQTGTTPPAGGSGSKPAPTIEDIVEAIAALNPTKDYGKNGKPNVEAIEAVLKADITATQRDQAWDIFRKEKDEDGKEE